VHDTFPSDCSPSALDSNGWTQSESAVLQSSSHDDSLSSIVAHGAEVCSSRRPTLMGGPIGNLIQLNVTKYSDQILIINPESDNSQELHPRHIRSFSAGTSAMALTGSILST
jgi:hypothetical protein